MLEFLTKTVEDAAKFAERNFVPTSSGLATGIGVAAGGVLFGMAIRGVTYAVEEAWDAIPETRSWAARQIAPSAPEKKEEQAKKA